MSEPMNPPGAPKEFSERSSLLPHKNTTCCSSVYACFSRALLCLHVTFCCSRQIEPARAIQLSASKDIS